MAKNLKRLISLALVIVMIMGMSVNILAAGANGISKNKTAEWSKTKEKVADVTLSVGGSTKDLSSDVIFVMGAGPSYGLVDVVDLVKNMMIAADGTSSKMKFGIVTFADTTENEIVLPLTEMQETDPTDTDPSDMDYIIAEAMANAKANPNSVNLHSSLETAYDLLRADTSVPADRKHVFVFTTGMGYFFDTADGTPATIVNTDSNGDPCWGNKTWLAVRNGLGNTDSGYPIPYGLSWNTYWNLICDWVQADGNTYTYVLDEIYAEFYNQNKTEDGIRFGYQIKNPDDRAAAMEVKVPYFPKKTVPLAMLSEEELADIYEIGGDTLLYAQNANHALNYERGMYEAWKTVNRMRNTGINVYPIQCSGSKWNKAGQISKGFMDMLAGGTCPTVHQAGYFDPIEDEILYALGAGSYVEDYIGYDEAAGYDFDFITDPDTIKLSVGAVDYTTTELETAEAGFDNSYAFTRPGEENPTFWLDYVKGEDPGDEMFKWRYGENVSNFAPVALKYQVKLVEAPEHLEQDLLLKTNISATITPVDSTGKEMRPEEFPVPELEIKVPTFTVTYVNGSEELQENDGLKTGDDIPGYEGNVPTKEADEDYTYEFAGWKLIEGTEGEDHTIGETDLVYEAQFTKTPIEKPEVPTYSVTYVNGTDELQTNTGLETGDDIPGYEGNVPTKASDGVYTYEFAGWKLIEGTEGADGTIGTTDLVYEATFTAERIRRPIPGGNDGGNGGGNGGGSGTTDIPDTTPPLGDVPDVFTKDHFAYIVGRDDGLIHPEASITRAEVATIFFRLLSDEFREEVLTRENDFSDVKRSDWYNTAISTMAEIGVVTGDPDGTFRPNSPITRAEFAAIAARFDPAGNEEGSFFSDTVGHWAEGEINIAANNGWVEGENGKYRPDDLITRAEAMTLVNRVLHRIPETPDDLLPEMIVWPDNMVEDAWFYLAVQEATNSHDYEHKKEIYEFWTELRDPRDWTVYEKDEADE